MRLIDWLLIVIGLSGIVAGLSGLRGADVISVLIWTLVLAIAALTTALGLKSLVEHRMRQLGKPKDA